MSSPLDAFPPEASESAQVLAKVDQPREDSGSWHPVFADIPLTPRAAIGHRRHTVVRLPTLAGVTGALRTMARPLMVRRERRVALVTTVPGAHVSVIATAAFTSAGVSLLTMWLWGQVVAPESRPLPAVVSTASAHSPALLEARQIEPPRALTAVAASLQPRTPTLPVPTPVVAVPAKPTPLPAAPRAQAAVPSPAKPLPPAPAPVKHASIARPAEPAPALSQTSAGTTAESDHNARATGTSGASGLLVITEPEGARVTINGVGWGTTPVAIPYLPSGSKRVRVTKSGYDSEERLVEPGAQTGATLRIELRESSAGRLPQ
jgi:PEGA domain